MPNNLQPIDTSTMIAIHESDFDRQIATAKRYPRSVGEAQVQIEAFATKNMQTAEECIFALPRAGKVIKGASARFAEIVAVSWGNARSAVRIVDEQEQFVVAQAVFHDLQTNVYTSIETMRRILERMAIASASI